ASIALLYSATMAKLGWLFTNFATAILCMDESSTIILLNFIRADLWG
ncbi:MAG: hypothetical protein ACI9SG_002562, partial [Maribacter sp.]